MYRVLCHKDRSQPGGEVWSPDEGAGVAQPDGQQRGADSVARSATKAPVLGVHVLRPPNTKTLKLASHHGSP